MKSRHLFTMSLLLLAALLLLSAPALAESQNTVVTLIVCEVAVVKDSSAQGIAFTINGESGKTSVFVAKGGTVTIDVVSVPAGKNLKLSQTGEADLTTSGLTITISNVQSEQVTVTMKLESAVPPASDKKPVIIPQTVGIKVVVENGGEVVFGDESPIYAVVLPPGISGEAIIYPIPARETPEGMDIHSTWEIFLTSYPDGEKSVIKYCLPLAEIVSRGWTEADVCLYAYEGTEWTKLPAVYRIVDGMVYYESETLSFPHFAIVFEEGSAKPKDSGGDEPVTPQPPEEEPCEPCYLCIVVLLVVLLAGIGATVAVKRK